MVSRPDGRARVADAAASSTPTGPGWALVGDAGHFKHPGTAQGIGDAVEQAICVAESLSGADPSLDSSRRLARHARRRALRVVLHVGTLPAARVGELVQRAGPASPTPPRIFGTAAAASWSASQR